MGGDLGLKPIIRPHLIRSLGGLGTPHHHVRNYTILYMIIFRKQYELSLYSTCIRKLPGTPPLITYGSYRRWNRR